MDKQQIDAIGADIQHDINNGYSAHEKICALYEAVTDGISLDRLEELCQAERDGRCVVLPFLPEETVYDVSDFFNGANQPEIYKLKDGWWNVGLGADGVKFELTYEGIMINHEDIGKTVFLTRESAEAALKEVNEHDT